MTVKVALQQWGLGVMNRSIGKDVAAGSDPGALVGAPVPQPLAPDVEDVLPFVARWRDAGRAAALATVVATWGSSPRPVGSQLAVDAEGNFVGSVSGGCIEGAVIGIATQVMAEGTPRVIAFGVSNDRAWEVGLACGGRVEVLVERVE